MHTYTYIYRCIHVCIHTCTRTTHDSNGRVHSRMKGKIRSRISWTPSRGSSGSEDRCSVGRTGKRRRRRYCSIDLAVTVNGDVVPNNVHRRRIQSRRAVPRRVGRIRAAASAVVRRSDGLRGKSLRFGKYASRRLKRPTDICWAARRQPERRLGPRARRNVLAPRERLGTAKGPSRARCR